MNLLASLSSISRSFPLILNLIKFLLIETFLPISALISHNIFSVLFYQWWYFYFMFGRIKNSSRILYTCSLLPLQQIYLPLILKVKHMCVHVVLLLKLLEEKWRIVFLTINSKFKEIKSVHWNKIHSSKYNKVYQLYPIESFINSGLT